MSILEWLGLRKTEVAAEGQAAGDTHTVRKIVRQLDGLPAERARFVAAFAYILNRVAHADLDISDDERGAMERIVTEHGGLPEAQAIIVVEVARQQTLLFGGTENYLVTREFNAIASREEKLRLLDCLFAVSAADQTICAAESRTIRQIADELMLEHADYIDVRSRYREHLAVFQAEDEGKGESESD